MRKDETLEQERERKKLEAELPGRILRCSERVSKLSAKVRQSTQALKDSHKPNKGGERSGTILQNGV